MTVSPSRPDFSDLLVHIGFPKTATTTLQDVVFQPRHGFHLLVQHPGYCVGLGPIVGPLVTGEGFDPAALGIEVRERMEATPSALVPVLSCERLSGSGTAFGIDRDAIAMRLRAALPGARILVGSREKESFRRSLHRQHVLAGSVAPSLEPSSYWWVNAVSNYRASYFDFAEQLAFYRGFFGSDHVVELPFELLLESPRAWLSLVADATGQSRALEALPRLSARVNSSEAPLAIRRQRYANYFRVSALNPHPLVSLPDSLSYRVGTVLEFLSRVQCLRRLHTNLGRVRLPLEDRTIGKGG